MALSRIWSAFIIIAILVATIKFLAVDGNQQIFTQLVIGKNGDSIKVKEQNFTLSDSTIQKALDSSARVTIGTITYKKEGDKLCMSINEVKCLFIPLIFYLVRFVSCNLFVKQVKYIFPVT